MQTGSQEVHEGGVITHSFSVDGPLQRTRARDAHTALERHYDGLAVLVEELGGPLGALPHCRRGWAKHFHDAQQLLVLVCAWEEGPACVQLGEDAGKGPHVDGVAIRAAQNDFRCSVETRLDVRVHALVLVAARAQINDSDCRVAWPFQQDVLWLEVAVHDLQAPQEAQRGQELHSDLPDESQRKALELVQLCRLVQVHSHDGEGDGQVLPEGESVLHVDDAGTVRRVGVPDLYQQVHLHLCLLMEALFVPHKLQRDISARLVVPALEHLAEGASAQLGEHFVPESDVVADDDAVLPVFIIVAMVVRGSHTAFDLGRAWFAKEVHHFVVQNLSLLVVGQRRRHEQQGLGAGHGKVRNRTGLAPTARARPQQGACGGGLRGQPPYLGAGRYAMPRARNVLGTRARWRRHRRRTSIC